MNAITWYFVFGAIWACLVALHRVSLLLQEPTHPVTFVVEFVVNLLFWPITVFLEITRD